MATETFKKVINDNNYNVQQMTPDKALPLKFELVAMFGAALKELLGVQGKSEEEQAVAFASVIQKVMTENSPQEVYSIIKKVVLTVNINEKRMDEKIYNETFTGSHTELYKVFAWVIMENFKDFLAEIGLNLNTL